MTRDEERSVQQFRGRVGLLYLLKYGLAALTAWAFLYGTAVLALRAAVGLPRLDLAWGLASLPLALAPAAWLAWRRLPSAAAVRALLDRHGRCGGLLMAGAEQPIGEWQERLPEVRQPALRWRGERSWGLFVAGLAFVALAFLVPQGLADLVGHRLDVDREADALAKQIDVLEQEKVLDKQRSGDLKASLEQVKREAKGKDPVKTLESLDHLKDLASKAAQEAAESATRKMEDLSRAETFAEAMEKLAGKMDKGQLAEAMHEMAVLAKKALDERELLESGLDPATLEALKNSTLSPEQTKKLMEALKNAKEGTKAKVGRLVKAKLIDASALEKCDKAGKCDCAGLAAYLKENGAKSDLSDAIAMSEEPGKGGVSRGPGPAKIQFGDESSEEGAKFKEEELPASELQSLKDSELSGLSTGIPQLGKKAGAARSGALAGAKAGGGSASTQVVLPRHRGAVGRYFERPAMPPKK
jgi:hypothetical protein